MRTAVVSAAALALGAGVADAHIHLTYPKSRTDSALSDQKTGPCGVAGQVRNPDRVTELKPGQKITVTWKETVPHEGHFRIAFQPNGDKFNNPPDGTGPRKFPNVSQTGKTDATGALILLDMIKDNNSSTTATLSAMVTMPNMECNNCTLQFIQVMINPDPAADSSYSPDDIYFNCADLTLSNSAPVTPPPDPTPTPDAGPDEPPGTPGPTGGGSAGGCSSTGGGQAGWALFALAALVLFGRRRRWAAASALQVNRRTNAVFNG